MPSLAPPFNFTSDSHSTMQIPNSSSTSTLQPFFQHRLARILVINNTCDCFLSPGLTPDLIGFPSPPLKNNQSRPPQLLFYSVRLAAKTATPALHLASFSYLIGRNNFIAAFQSNSSSIDSYLFPFRCATRVEPPIFFFFFIFAQQVWFLFFFLSRLVDDGGWCITIRACIDTWIMKKLSVSRLNFCLVSLSMNAILLFSSPVINASICTISLRKSTHLNQILILAALISSHAQQLPLTSSYLM